MTRFNVGDRVVAISRGMEGQKGFISEVYGDELYEVFYDSGLNWDEEADNLELVGLTHRQREYLDQVRAMNPSPRLLKAVEAAEKDLMEGNKISVKRAMDAIFGPDEVE